MELTHAIRRAFNLNADTATHDEIRTRILSGGQVTGTNMCVLICAILIASVGLNTGSTAVIIGAMLISPLMGSILAMAYGAAAGDSQRFRRHLYGFLIQLIISLCVSTVYFLLSPINFMMLSLQRRAALPASSAAPARKSRTMSFPALRLRQR